MIRRRILLYVLGSCLYGVMYLGTNHIELFKPSYLPAFAFEEKIPFLPWTIWLYTSNYIYWIFVVALAEEKHIRNYMWSFVVFVGINFFIFLFFPTAYPRELWPATGDDIHSNVLNWVRLSDTPRNCFPSAHIGNSVLGMLFIRHSGKVNYLPFLVWTMIVSISTLTVKQHYFIDIFAGALVAYLSFRVIFRQDGTVGNFISSNKVRNLYRKVWTNLKCNS